MNRLAGPPLRRDVPLPSHIPIPIAEPRATMVRWRVPRERWSCVSAPWSTISPSSVLVCTLSKEDMIVFGPPGSVTGWSSWGLLGEVNEVVSIADRRYIEWGWEGDRRNGKKRDTLESNGNWNWAINLHYWLCKPSLKSGRVGFVFFPHF